ncbi:MAG: SCO1664 family protein [Litorilinea sp.]
MASTSKSAAHDPQPTGSQPTEPHASQSAASGTDAPDQDAPEQDATAETMRITETRVVETLSTGKVSEKGLLPYSSNHSFLITVQHEGLTLPAVYKPRQGENPLWDFEWGTLCLREAAAYYISHCLDWNLVPPTIVREASRGVGSIQLYIANREAEHYFTVQADARFAQTFRRLALFDYVINNADRKSGHCLVGNDGRIWAIDHGICFHTEYKLRTVIWEFSDTPIEPELLENLHELQTQLSQATSTLNTVLETLLTKPERASLCARVERLIARGRYPSPIPQRRNYPWPPI